MHGSGSLRDRYLYYLVHLKGVLTHGFRRTHFGQWGEDIALKSVLGERKNGFYIDVGAYHPLHYSNTHLLYKAGWKGINIDPNPDSIRLMKLYRPRDLNLQLGIGEHEERKPYFVFNHQSCNTFSPEQKERMLARPFIRLIQETEVACRPLQAIIDAHAAGKDIDLLNVDVEGMSMPVLRSLNFSKTRPYVICIEDDDFDATKENFGSEVHAFLAERSYMLVARTGLSSLYRSLT